MVCVYVCVMVVTIVSVSFQFRIYVSNPLLRLRVDIKQSKTEENEHSICRTMNFKVKNLAEVFSCFDTVLDNVNIAAWIVYGIKLIALLCELAYEIKILAWKVVPNYLSLNNTSPLAFESAS